MSIPAGISKAKQEGKNLFVDTYAKWCIPCKKMKSVFADKDVAAYFNDHYVNIKIDMDTPRGKTTYADYDVIFLPTMFIFDKNGNVKYKTDKLLSAQELLSIGSQANVEGVYLGDNASKIVSTPMQKKKATKKNKATPRKVEPVISSATPELENKDPILTKTEEGEIVYVLGSRLDDAPPEILFQEAYFRLQLMDGSHRETVTVYLNSQEDWNSEKNIRFINDFVESTDSPLFDHMIENKALYESILGVDNVKQNIRILVNQRITQGYPRPDLEEAKVLYSYINKKNVDQQAYLYYLNTLLIDEDYKTYRSIANDYLTNVNPNDSFVMYKLADLYAEGDILHGDIESYQKWINKAIEIKPQEPYYKFTSAKLYLLSGDKKKAKKEAVEAQLILNEKSGDLMGDISAMLRKLEKL